ncbi:MAG TPA: hypothetical protein VGJ32_03310 [Solirubrobacteraceae bacterium]|jgi:hypothetical protein
MSLLDRAIEAHGGAERWAATEALDVALHARGPAFALKGRRGRQVRATLQTDRPLVTFHDYPSPGSTGTFDAGLVHVDGEERSPADARASAAKLRWDDLAELYFDAYAVWQYMTAPFGFTAPGFEVAELDDRRLRVRYPPGIPVHSRDQVYYFDERARLVRLDYTAEVMSRFARAAHLCSEHREFDGLLFPARRRVHPRLPGGRVLRAVTLVAIDSASVAARPRPR